MKEKFLSKQQVHALVFLCSLHILLLILQDFKNRLPSQNFSIYRTWT